MRRVLVALAFAVTAFASAPANAAGFLQDLFEGASRRPAPIVYHYAPAEPHIRTVLDSGFRVSRRPTIAKKSLKARQAALKRKLAKKNAAALAWQRKNGATAPRKASALKVAMPSNVASTRTAAVTQPSGPNPALCCKNGEDPAKLIHSDTTLRYGDAYMTPQGLRIYRGRIKAERAAFVDFRKAEIAKEMKQRLAALEERRILELYAEARAKVEPRVVAAKDKPAPAPAPVVLGAANSASQNLPGRQAAFAPLAPRTSLDQQGRIIRVVGP